MHRSMWSLLGLAAAAAAMFSAAVAAGDLIGGTDANIVVAADDSQTGGNKPRKTRSAFSLSPNVPNEAPSEGDTGQRPKSGSGGNSAPDGDKSAGGQTSGPTTGSVTRGLKPRSP